MHIIFLKRLFCSTKIRYGIRRNIWSLFGRLYLSSLKGKLISHSNFFKILERYELTYFLNATMPLVVVYMIIPFLDFVFGLHSILDYCGKEYNA